MSDEMRAIQGAIYGIIEALLKRNDLNSAKLSSLYTPPARLRKEKAPRQIPFDPKSWITWDYLFGFGANGRKYLFRGSSKLPKHPIQGSHIARIRKVALGLFDLSEHALAYKEHDQATWTKLLDVILKVLGVAKLRDDLGGTQSEFKNLLFIGDAEAGVEKFLEIYGGATSVYNTVFTRSEEPFAYIRDRVPKFQDAMRELMDKGCTWHDIVTTSEEVGISKFYKTLNVTQKARYRARRLSSKLPLFQCLVIRKNEAATAALVGWSFSGTPKSHVYFTNYEAACEYFYDYCRILFALARPWIEPLPRRKRMPATKPSGAKR